MSITRRSFCSALAAAPAILRARSATPRPNIVLILADDLGSGDLRCYNRESKIPTPNLDRLSGEGVRFTDMHSPSSVCTPTRYGLLTGRYCWRSRLKRGVLQGFSPNLIEPGRLTLASMLKAQGYYTAGVGKWHLGLGDRPTTDFDQPLTPGPCDHGFDEYYGIPASLDMPPYLYFENRRVVERATSTTPGQRRQHAQGRLLALGTHRAALRYRRSNADAHPQGHVGGAREGGEAVAVLPLLPDVRSAHAVDAARSVPWPDGRRRLR